jgi:hypothetical protein
VLAEVVDLVDLSIAAAAQRSSQSLTVRLLGTGRSKQGESYMREELEDRLDMYADFAILEQRVQGTFPAVESIRVVRERTRTAGQD